MAATLLDALVGSELGSVVFVRDHLQLDLDAGRLTVLVWPSVVVDGTTTRRGHTGYRDLLCALIGAEVTSVAESRELGLVLRFGTRELVVHPTPDELDGPEIALLRLHAADSGNGPWACWRPGEGVFAGPGWD